MKKFGSLFVAIALVASVLTTAISPYAYADTATNLISNPSLEMSSNGQTPDNWTSNAWGANTTSFSYNSSGRTGSKSVHIAMDSRTGGDAKWMHDQVSVTAGSQYTYSGYHKSSTNTEIDAQFIDSAGNYSYAYIGFVPAASDWVYTSFNFTVPVGVVKTVVMHVIAAPGTLDIDDVSLVSTVATTPIPTPDPTPTPTPDPTPSATNLILNGNVEEGTTNAPSNWKSKKTGTNTVNFAYVNNGYLASKSLSVNMTARTSGNAKWMHTAVAVTPGSTYTYSAYYQSTVITNLVLQYTNTSGKVSTKNILTVPASSTWKQLTTDIIMPADAVKAVIIQQINRVGSFQTDEHSLILKITTPPVTPPTDPGPPVVPPVTDGNLIANPSFETVNGTTPVDWFSNNWGTNSVQFSVGSTGHTGSKSATTTVTSYSDGDAKWYANFVTVTSGKTYEYSDYYKSTVGTRVVVAYQTATGVYSYAELAVAPAASNWQMYQTTFTVPEGVTKASVFHLIDSVGSLTIDDVSLVQKQSTPVPPTPSTIVPNSSLETASGATPASWSNNSWGTNNASFTYATEGHTGSKSVKVAVSGYTDGDAKWYFNPITTLTPGGLYKYELWYKTNARSPKVVAMYTNSAGAIQYVGLPNAVPNGLGDWQLYSQSFQVPTGAQSASIFMMLAENGWLQTDDYSISEYTPIGFNRPLLTLTFDDGHEDNVDTALPLLNQYGFKSTQCFATSFLEGLSAVAGNVEAFYNSGHEICSHTVTHPFLTNTTDAVLTYELAHSQWYLESIIGQPVRNFASPYGDYDTRVINEISKYYQSHRTVDQGYNSKDNFDKYRLKVQNVLSTTTAQEISGWIAQAQKDNTWLILLYHRVASDPGQYDTYTSVFAQHLAAISASGITVKTYQDALTELTPQL